MSRLRVKARFGALWLPGTLADVDRTADHQHGQANDPAASSIMRDLAHGLIAEMSVGLTAVAVQKASGR